MVVWGACTAPLFGVPYCPILQRLSVYGGRCLHWQRCGEGESLVDDFRFISLGFIGPGASLGDWRKAVISRMAAPKGPTVDHR